MSLAVKFRMSLVWIARFSDDDAPYTTDIQLEESAADSNENTAIIVMDGISDAWVSPQVQHQCGTVLADLSLIHI